MNPADFSFAPHYFGPPGRRMHYIDEGTGSPLLFVHGNPTWSYYWRTLLGALRSKYRVIAPDHLGCGLSDKPQDDPYRLAGHIKNLTALVDHLGLEKVTLVVHDWGGPIGLGFARLRPERIKRLVIFNTAAFSTGKLPWRLSACRIPGLGAVAVRGLNGFARAATWMATSKGLSPEVKRMYLKPYNSYRNRIATHRFVVDIPLTSDHPSWNTLDSIDRSVRLLQDRPTALIWGGQDWVFHKAFFDEWRRRLPGAEAHWLEDAGHYVVEDASERIVPLVSEFLERTDHVL